MANPLAEKFFNVTGNGQRSAPITESVSPQAPNRTAPRPSHRTRPQRDTLSRKIRGIIGEMEGEMEMEYADDGYETGGDANQLETVYSKLGECHAELGSYLGHGGEEAPIEGGEEIVATESKFGGFGNATGEPHALSGGTDLTNPSNRKTNFVKVTTRNGKIYYTTDADGTPREVPKNGLINLTSSNVKTNYVGSGKLF